MYVGVIHGLGCYFGAAPCIPHVCGGDPTVLFEDLKKRVVFPMYVGVILNPSLFISTSICIPHVCGGDPIVINRPFWDTVYSPCMWG